MASCTFRPGNLDASGDNLYGPRSCHRPFIDWARYVFDMNRGDWDEGFGWTDACSVRRPFGRTLNGLWCLAYSAEDFRNESFDSNILQWGCRYARREIDELDGRCGRDNVIAQTFWGPIIDNRTVLFLDFFAQSVSLRAGSVIHEARHAHGCNHNRGTRDSSWGYNGAWRFQVAWLAWFVAAGAHTTAAMREMARDRANTIINENFSSHPGFNI